MRSYVEVERRGADDDGKARGLTQIIDTLLGSTNTPPTSSIYLCAPRASSMAWAMSYAIRKPVLYATFMSVISPEPSSTDSCSILYLGIL